MAISFVQLLVRLLVAVGLCYVLGFERELRGSPAGDRTFSLIGVSTALIGIVASHGAPFVLAGAITGIGFIGGGLTYRQATERGGALRGVPTAAAILAAAAIGAAAGLGFLSGATVGAAIILLVLEVDHIPGLRVLDARRWSSRFANDYPAESNADMDPNAPDSQ